MNKGETLLDTAMTLNAMQCDLLVVRHAQSGAPALLAQKVDAAVINAGDGTARAPDPGAARRAHHPPPPRPPGGADGRDLRRHRCTSRVARSNIHLLTAMGSRVRVVGPPTLIPAEVERLGVEVFHDMDDGLDDVDIVMMLRLQSERMTRRARAQRARVFPLLRPRRARLALAKPDALVMHPGPMNRGVEIDSEVADDLERSVIQRAGRDGRRGAHGGARQAVRAEDAPDAPAPAARPVAADRNVRLLDPGSGLDRAGRAAGRATA